MSELTTQVSGQRVKPRRFEIFINGTRYEIAEPVLTGARLKVVAGIPAANHLFQDVPGHQEDPQILDDQEVEMRSGLHFYDVPVGNLGANR
jgi:hypothetical protein